MSEEKQLSVRAIRQITAEKLSVQLSDGTVLPTTLGTVTELRLYAGLTLDEERLEALRQASRLALARDKALELLARRPLSKKELCDKLQQKGEGEETAARCAAWLEERGLLNEADYAAAITRHYAAKGYGEGRVRAELSRRGLPRELWEDALRAMPEPEDKLDQFIAARLKDPQDRSQVQKISSALFRRGYSWEDIRSALRRYSAETEE